MPLLDQVLSEFGRFWLVALRISGVMFVAPVFANRSVPPPARVFLTLMTALALLPVSGRTAVFASQPGTLAYVAAAVGELFLGLILGYLVLLVFVAVQVAGQLLDLEMGFGIVTVMDPQFGQPAPLVGNFLYLISLLLFLLIDGHHQLLRALAYSFERVPVGAMTTGPALYARLFESFSWMFTSAARMALPALAALFLTSAVMAVLARTMPQLNVFIVGLPLKILVGLGTLIVALPFFLFMLERLFPENMQALARVLEAAGAGVVRP